uniref:Uncharacterized protein n=1 Tax=Opuntia streptacantha TaxID=393608 RepID=A0A7C9D3W9_OPUST
MDVADTASCLARPNSMTSLRQTHIKDQEFQPFYLPDEPLKRSNGVFTSCLPGRTCSTFVGGLSILVVLSLSEKGNASEREREALASSSSFAVAISGGPSGPFLLTIPAKKGKIPFLDCFFSTPKASSKFGDPSSRRSSFSKEPPFQDVESSADWVLWVRCESTMKKYLWEDPGFKEVNFSLTTLLDVPSTCELVLASHIWPASLSAKELGSLCESQPLKSPSVLLFVLV